MQDLERGVVERREGWVCRAVCVINVVRFAVRWVCQQNVAATVAASAAVALFDGINEWALLGEMCNLQGNYKQVYTCI